MIDFIDAIDDINKLSASLNAACLLSSGTEKERDVSYSLLLISAELASSLAQEDFSQRRQERTKSCRRLAMVTISSRLRTQREACGLTTAELARLLNLDEEIIIQWESGKYEPTISMLIPLANILGCDPMWLLTGEVTPPEQPKSEEQQHHDASQQVCSLSREALLRKNQYQW